jgi:hypothetical protein
MHSRENFATTTKFTQSYSTNQSCTFVHSETTLPHTQKTSLLIPLTTSVRNIKWLCAKG